MYQIAIFMGFITYACLALTLMTGMRVIKVKPKTHKTIGITTAIGASMHVGLIAYLYF